LSRHEIRVTAAAKRFGNQPGKTEAVRLNPMRPSPIAPLKMTR
jgi:hypothetical protein